MWPFIRPFGESGRSRLTRDPGRRSPRLLRFSVSGARSAENESGCRPATVRQTPLTAMLAPTAASLRTVAQPTERRVPAAAPVVTTVPSSSIIPVNIKVSFDGKFVGRNGHRVRTDQPRPHGEDSAPAPFDLFLASIATCMGFYALRFCQERGIATEGLGLSLAI